MNCPGQWLCNEVGHLFQAFWPVMVGQLGKDLINFVTLHVTFRVKGQGDIHPYLVLHTAFAIPIEKYQH